MPAVQNHHHYLIATHFWTVKGDDGNKLQSDQHIKSDKDDHPDWLISVFLFYIHSRRVCERFDAHYARRTLLILRVHVIISRVVTLFSHQTERNGQSDGTV